MASIRGIPLSKVSPAFLHANSTSHTWVFSAFAELIDNAYDPDVSASELLIDKIDINGVPCLIFLDNGAGMDTDHLLKMLSFGFCEKSAYEKKGSHQPIGHYGNGFKSGSMRIGHDALVFTRCHKSASIGFLSQSYLTAVQTDSVVVPILEYRLPSLERIKSQESRNNLDAILNFSVFKMEDELKEELKALEGSKTGTKIIISNLKRLQGRTYELDFSSDPRDIRCPEAHEADLTTVYNRPIQQTTSEYKRSLREYCSILFLRPRMKITIRGGRVKSRLISKSLSNTEIDMYKPTWLSRPVKIIFGFKCEKGRAEDCDYGMMLYHRNRLIKAFEKVGYQKQPNGLGIGVVGVAQVDFLQPIHNKQDFNKDEKFNSVMAAFSNKLNDYWNEKKGSNSLSSLQPIRNLPDWLWAQCDHCLKWRRLPDEFDSDTLPDLWYCRMNPDATHNRCDIPEEPEDEDLAMRPTYEKTFKKKQEERKRQQQIEREKEEDAKRRKIMEKERELKQKEATLRAIQHVASSQPDNRTVTSLQKALAEVRRKEEQQKRLILQIQEQKKLMEEQRNSLLQMAENLQTADKTKSKDVLKQMSQLIGTFTSKSTTSSPVLSSKRKLNEEIPVTPNAKSRKKMSIKTETGEVLSIIQNDLDSDDNEDIDTSHNSPISTSRNGSVLPVKSETVKDTCSPSRKVQLNSPATNNPTNSSTKGDKRPEPAVQQLSPKIGAVTDNAAETSSPTKPRRKQLKGTVMAVIDLTSESEFGELVDIKPDLDGLRAAVQENLQQGQEDMKPDKDTLDEVISNTDDANKQKATVPPLDEAKQEIIETSEQSNTAASSKRASESQEITNVKNDDKICFGPSEDDPEFPMSIPDNFQENLEAAMAAIQERMEREKVEQESIDDHSLTESNISVNESTDEMKTEKAATESSSKQHIHSESTGDSNNLRADEVEAEKDGKEEMENEDASPDFTFKDVMILSGDDGSSDCDGPAEDDNDYRDYSTLYEKGDSSEPHIGRKQCDSIGESRNNSIEDGGGSSNQGISDDGASSVQQENVESPEGKLIEVGRPGKTHDSLSEEQNSPDCPGSKVECELQNRVDGDSSESLANVDKNVEFACLDSLTNVKDSSNNLSCAQEQVPIAQTSVGDEVSHDSIVGPALNVDNANSQPIVEDVEGSVHDQHSAGRVITESSPSHPGTLHENSMNTENSICEDEDLADNEQNLCENKNSRDSEKNLCENKNSMDSEKNLCESKNSMDSEKNLCENKNSRDSEKNLCDSFDLVQKHVSNQENMSINFRNNSTRERFNNDDGLQLQSNSTLRSSVPSEERSLSLSAHTNVQFPDNVSFAVESSSIILEDNVSVAVESSSIKLEDSVSVESSSIMLQDNVSATVESSNIRLEDNVSVAVDSSSIRLEDNVSVSLESSSIKLEDNVSVESSSIMLQDNVSVSVESSSIKLEDNVSMESSSIVLQDNVSVSMESSSIMLQDNVPVSMESSSMMLEDNVSVSVESSGIMLEDNVSVSMESSSIMLEDKLIDDEIIDTNDTAELKCKEQVQPVLCEFDTNCNKHCDLKRTSDQRMQTDLDMSAVSEVLRQHEDFCVGGMCGHNGFHLTNKQCSNVEKLDKSFQTISTVESQTEKTELKNGRGNKEEIIEKLEKELAVSRQHFEEVDKRLSEINVNIHKLLGILSPETELGDVNNIHEIIRDMIKVHADPCQEPESQD